MASVPDWVWVACGWCAVVFGASGVLFGRLWWRRYKKNTRVCGRCGYDMAGLESLTCPECGRVAKSERDLKPRRARMRWRVVGLVVLLGGWCLLRAPAMRMCGWAAGAPAWALLLFAPTEVDTATVNRATAGQFAQQSLVALWPTRGSASSKDSLLTRLRNDMYVELWRRIYMDDLPAFVVRWHLRRVLPSHAAPGSGIAAPAMWPFEQEIKPQSEWAGAASVPATVRTTYRIDQTSKRDVERDVSADVGGKWFPLYTLRSPIDAHMTTEEFMGPVSSPEMDAQFLRAYRPRAWEKWDCLWIEFPTPVHKEDLVGLPRLMTVGVKVRLGEEVLGTGTCDLTDAFVTYSGVMFASMKWYEGAQARALANLKDVEIEITGKPADSFYWYAADPKTERRAWAGRVTIKPGPRP